MRRGALLLCAAAWFLAACTTSESSPADPPQVRVTDHVLDQEGRVTRLDVPAGREDEVFVDHLRRGLGNAAPAAPQAIAAAHGQCKKLRDQVSPEQVVRDGLPPLSLEQAAGLTYLAALVYCPEQLERLNEYGG